MRIGGFEKFSLIDYPGHICAIIFTVGCNFRCPFCHNPSLVEETNEKTFTEKQIFDFLEKRKGVLEAVTITGGEPTMQPDLIPFIEKIKSMGYKVKLDSNGTDPDTLEKIIGMGIVDYLAMDIKAPLSKYMQTVGRPVDANAIAKSIELIKNSGIDYEFRTTVVKSLLPKEDFDEIGKMIQGSKKYFLQKFIPTKILNPQFLKKVTYSDEEFDLIRTQMEQYVDSCSIR